MEPKLILQHRQWELGVKLVVRHLMSGDRRDKRAIPQGMLHAAWL